LLLQGIVYIDKHEIAMNVARRRRGSSKSEDTAETEKLVATTSTTTNNKYGVSSSSWSGDDDKENTMGRDRTAEFQSALRSLQGRAQTRQPNPMAMSNHSSRNDRSLQQYSEFMKVAK